MKFNFHKEKEKLNKIVNSSITQKLLKIINNLFKWLLKKSKWLYPKRWVSILDWYIIKKFIGTYISVSYTHLTLPTTPYV